jgi:hypothetical protein
MKVDGGCHCGNIAYEAEIEADKVSLCHCTDCQILTGTAYRTSVPAAAPGFRLTRGQPKIYVKTAESGRKRAQAFCPDCGTPIYASAIEAPALYNIRVGTIRQRGALHPSRQIWRRSALPWATNIGALPSTDKE